MGKIFETEVAIRAGEATVLADLSLPPETRGLVVFAHGTGSSRHSPRNRQVAEHLGGNGFGTLLMDLLTPDEEREERFTRHHRFDIGLLSRRLVAATRWAHRGGDTAGLPIGYFGASTGAAAALVAAVELADEVSAVVSRGGRPDMAESALPLVKAPTLLVVGGADHPVIELNRQALEEMRAPAELEIVPGATHLFEEPGALERVAELAAGWFERHLGPPPG